jgi:hypothetical protein
MGGTYGNSHTNHNSRDYRISDISGSTCGIVTHPSPRCGRTDAYAEMAGRPAAGGRQAPLFILSTLRQS